MNFNFCPKCGTKGSVQHPNNTAYVCTKCGWQFWNNAKACATLVFIQHDQLLFSTNEDKADPNFGTFDLPGGFVDYGESAQQAAVREAKEELTVTVQEADLELIAAYHNNYMEGVTTIDLVFIVKKWVGDIIPSDDVTSIEWKSISALDDPQFVQKNYTGLNKILAKHTGEQLS